MTDVKIIRQKRRSMMMRPVPGGFEVYIPHWMKPSSAEVKRFIKEGLAKLDDHQLPVPAEQTSRAEVLAMVDERRIKRAAWYSPGSRRAMEDATGRNVERNLSEPLVYAAAIRERGFRVVLDT